MEILNMEMLLLHIVDIWDGNTFAHATPGTGKTTTLVRYTQLRPNLKFLLVVYNK